jgi:hypothetical protein
MKFLIEKVYSKGIGKINEDELLIKDNVFGVFDGVGSLVKFLNKKGKTGGKIAAEIAKNTFSKRSKTLEILAIETNNLIKEEMKKNKINTRRKEVVWGTCASVVRIHEKFAEFFQIGDSLILTINKKGKSKLITKYYDQDKETMILWKRLGSKKAKEKFSKLQKQIADIRKTANKNYGLLNGDSKAIKFFNTGKFSLKNIRNIIIFTDGLLIPKEEPKRKEDWNHFSRIYNKSGLKSLLRYVRSIENKDPDCYIYPRFKKHDDVAAIAIKIK